MSDGPKLTCPEGTTFRQQFTLKDQDNVAIDLTNGTMTFSLFRREASTGETAAASVTKTVGSGIVLTTPLSGICTVTLDPDDTKNQSGNQWDWELEFVDSGGDVWLAGKGEFLITPRRLD